MKKNNKGFTLVELIVVLVILAILAAILVPALLGYIDKARNSQYEEEAHSILTAVQAKATEDYVYGLSDEEVLEECLDSYEFVIMYDNSWKRPLYADIVQYASRMSNIQRTIDINITQQKTNRIITADSSTLVSIKDMLKKIDDNEETIVKFDGIDLGNLDVKLTPAQIVFDKLEEQKEKTWAEFLRLVGVANLTTQKKERNIVDEIRAMQGGTIASRYTRFSPRQDAIDRINAMFKDKLVEPLSIDYYDGEPSTEEKTEEVGDEYDRSESI